MATAAGAAIVRAAGGLLARDLRHNGLINRVHQRVDFFLCAIELYEYGMLDDLLIERVNALLNTFDHLHIVLGLCNRSLHCLLLNVILDHQLFHLCALLVRVLCDGVSKSNASLYSGRTEGNKIAFFEGTDADTGCFVKVLIERVDPYALYGKKV